MGDCFAPRWRSSTRAMLRCLGLSALIAIAGCAPDPVYECVNIASGETLTVSLILVSDARWGFTGTDKDGWTRNVNKRQAPWWKCREASASVDDYETISG